MQSMLLVGTILIEENDRTGHFSGIPARGGHVKEGLAWMSGDDPARKVEFYFLSNLELEAFPFGDGLDDP